jgi:hypothetical protein
VRYIIKYLQYINGDHSSNTPTNHLAIELQHISKKYPILSVFYRYQKWFKYHILAHMGSSESKAKGLFGLISELYYKIGR